MWLRRTFCGSCNPPAWCAFSEAQPDLANDMMADSSWEIEDLITNFLKDNPIKIERLSEIIPYADAKLTMVLAPPREFGSAESFIDDGNQLAVDIKNNVWRAVVVVIASIIAMARENNDECIPRDLLLEIVTTIKLGYPKEIQLTLGWICNYRTLMVSLPTDKFNAWSKDIHQSIEEGSLDKKSLEKLRGRLLQPR
jgi:hypothetical protein